mmetsp:Transcript_33743/g.73847  ORF Transcript_33743/g.73847 Transcript_33743/m.73847 type:complete len:507 (-) Transcript_33743:70-1590(-)
MFALQTTTFLVILAFATAFGDAEGTGSLEGNDSVYMTTGIVEQPAALSAELWEALGVATYGLCAEGGSPSLNLLQMGAFLASPEPSQLQKQHQHLASDSKAEKADSTKADPVAKQPASHAESRRLVLQEIAGADQTLLAYMRLAAGAVMAMCTMVFLFFHMSQSADKPGFKFGLPGKNLSEAAPHKGHHLDSSLPETRNLGALRLGARVLGPVAGAPSLLTPLTGRQCVLYTAGVSRKTEENPEHEPVAFAAACTDFFVALTDKDVPQENVEVRGGDLPLFDIEEGSFSEIRRWGASPEHWKAFALHGEQKGLAAEDAATLEFQERALLVGASVTLFGELHRLADGTLTLQPPKGTPRTSNNDHAREHRNFMEGNPKQDMDMFCKQRPMPCEIVSTGRATHGARQHPLWERKGSPIFFDVKDATSPGRRCFSVLRTGRDARANAVAAFADHLAERLAAQSFDRNAGQIECLSLNPERSLACLCDEDEEDLVVDDKLTGASAENLST